METVRDRGVVVQMDDCCEIVLLCRKWTVVNQTRVVRDSVSTTVTVSLVSVNRALQVQL